MKAIVTGGAGFIGSHVVDALINTGVDVVVLDDLSGGYRDNVNSQALFIEGSILDRDLIGDLFEQHAFDYVYHLAAYAAEGLSAFIRHFNYANNLLGSINLINASIRHEIKCFVFTSSIAVYGSNQLPMKEDMPPAPEDPYGIAKFAVELDLRNAHEMFGLDYIVFRPHNVYGERQNIADKYRNVIGIFMNQIMQNKSLTIFGDGEQSRAFTHIADVAPVIADSVNCPEAFNQIFNVGSDDYSTVNELVEIVAQSFGVRPKVNHLKERLEVKHAYAEHSKLSRILGYTSSISLQDGIQRMADWAREFGPRESKEFGNIEITEGLPESWAQLVN